MMGGKFVPPTIQLWKKKTEVLSIFQAIQVYFCRLHFCHSKYKS